MRGVWLLLALGLAAPAGAAEEFAFLNAAGEPLRVNWLPKGADDPTEGVHIGRVDSGSNDAPSTLRTGVGSQGHAFRLHGEETSTPPLVHLGGGMNLVAVGGASLESEVVGPTQLRSLVLGLVRACLGDSDYVGCCHAKARTPGLGIRVPSEIVDTLSEVYSPVSKSPEMFGTKPVGRDALVVLSSLPYPVSIQWAWLADESYEGSDVPDGEGKPVGEVAAASSAGEAAHVAIQARAGDIFFATASSAQGGVQRRAKAFSYPDELSLAVLGESSDPTGGLIVEQYDEDALKVFLSDALRSCAESAGLTPAEVARVGSNNASALGWDWQACFRGGAKLPSGGALLPAELSVRWVHTLWGTINHWLLCSFKQSSVPIETKEVHGSASGGNQGAVMRADVLRRTPLVVAVHSLATPEECAQLQGEAGDLSSLGRAHVSGGTTSRDRRTLSKNLYPGETNDTLTRLAARFFETARQLTGYELDGEGQEPVNWLYYKSGYEYRPHCDGACGTRSVNYGSRVASSLLYCAVADDGGGTVFPPDGLKIEPTVGMLLLFTYNPDPDGLSRHAACPVLRGEKMTATQWYREGVTAKHDWEFAAKGGRLPRRKKQRSSPRRKRERQEV